MRLAAKQKTVMGNVSRRFEADARAVVAVDDEIGGTVIYTNGRPSYYVLDGEWFQAVHVPGSIEKPGQPVSTS